MTRRQNILVSSTLGCSMFFVVALFKAQSWSEIPYNSTGGQYMLRLYRERFAENQATWVLWPDTETKADEDKVIVVAFHPTGRVLPEWLRWIKSKTDNRSDSPSFAYSSICHVKPDPIILPSSYGASKLQDYEKIAPLVKNLEPNTRLRLNEDFVVISYKGNLRVYAMSQASEITKRLIEKLGVTRQTWDAMNNNN